MLQREANDPIRKSPWRPGKTSRSHPDAENPRDLVQVTITFEELGAVFDEFIDEATHVTKLSPWTIGNYRNGWRNFTHFVQAERLHHIELTPATVRAWLRWNDVRLTDDRTLKPSTLHTYWRSLRSFFTFVARREILPNPFHGLRPPTLGVHEPRATHPNDCARILSTTRNLEWPHAYERARALAVIGLALYAGLRRSEILGLTLEDVDYDLSRISVRNGKGRGDGKGRKVPMSPELRRILAEYRSARRRAGIEAPEFLSSRQKRRGMSLITIRRIVRRISKASQVRFGLHDLRASFLTAVLCSGQPIHVAAALAGHTAVTTTQRYLNPFEDDMRDAVRGLSFERRPRR